MAHRVAFLMLSVLQVHSWDYFEGGKDWTGVCETGKNQSPIDLSDKVLTHVDETNDIPSIHFDLDGTFETTFEHTGTGAFVNYKKFGLIKFDSKKIYVKNIHYHAPSEHSINGKLLDLELHFFSADSSGQGYGFAVLFEVGNKENKFVEASIQSYKEGKDQYFDTTWLVENEKLNNFYHYDGSITDPSTGDCSEIIIWTIISEPVEISQEQLDFFDDKWKNNKTFAGGNGRNRVIQDLNDRKVYFYSESDSESSAGYLAISLLGLLLTN